MKGKMKATIRSLCRQGFFHCGKLTWNGTRVHLEKCKDFPASNKTGLVYIWVTDPKTGDEKVRYVGKSEQPLKRRLDQHINSANARQGKGKLKNFFTQSDNEDKVIDIYAKATSITLMYGENVSNCELEEKALIQLFHKAGTKLMNIVRPEAL